MSLILGLFDGTQSLILLQVSMEDSHVMKFVLQGKSQVQNRGIRTFPHHTYGVSKESPDHFRQTHSLINHGYHYDHQHAPHFEYHSQKPSHVMAADHSHDPHLASIHNPHHSLHHNPRKFHLKKGRLGEFLDKNGWMNGVYKMTGHQRSERARSFNNQDRDSKIKNLKERIQYESEVIKKPVVNQSYFHTMETLMSERVRIRSRRNSEAQRQIPMTQRTISQLKVGEIQGENIKTKLAKTTREWYPSLKKHTREFSFKEMSKPSLQLETESKHLDEWQRKTCNSKWCYKPAGEDPFENQQQRQELI